jgi:hypothetical protein
MELSQCAYVFRAIASASSSAATEEEDAAASYQLEGICRARVQLEFTPPSAHSTLADNDWSQLQLLNARLVSEANALSLRLVLITRERGALVCALTRSPDAPLRILARQAHYDTTGAELPYVDGEPSLAHGAPVYSLLYSYFSSETGGYAFAGVAPVATRIVGMPLCLSRQRLQALQSDWYKHLCVDAPQQSRCFVVWPRSSETQLRWLHSRDGLARGC